MLCETVSVSGGYEGALGLAVCMVPRYQSCSLEDDLVVLTRGKKVE